MKSVADFYPLVLAASDIATDEHESVVHEAIRASAIAFMRETEIARDEMYIRAQCGVDEYPLDMPNCHILVGVRDVWIGGKASNDNPIKDDGWDKLHAGRHYNVDIHTTPNRAIYIDDAGKDWIYISYSYSIGRDGCDIPEFLYEEWAEAIVAGAVHRLKVRAGAAAATIELASYEQAVAIAKSRINRAYVRGKKFAHAKPFLGGRYR